MKNSVNIFCTGFLIYLAFPLWAQTTVTLKIDKEPLVIQVGETTSLQVKAVDENGEVLPDNMIFYEVLRQKGFVPTSGASVDSLGNVTGRLPGVYNLIVLRPGASGESFAKKYVELQVVNKEIAKLDVVDFPQTIYSGTSFRIKVKVIDESNMEVRNKDLKITSSNPKVARIDPLNYVYAQEPGNTSLIISAGKITSTVQFKVLKNPVERLSMQASQPVARTGDVLNFNASAYDSNGHLVKYLPILYTVKGVVDEDAAGASAIISDEGKFVAEQPGTYTILATSGNASASATLKIVPRNVQRDVEFTGHGRINKKHTSDLWVWEGVDGKDYAVTGTWSADGTAYFWDVSNPGNIRLTDSIQVDARTVNDVKVSEDGKVCVISREGASNRKNGIVILDVKDPRNVAIISTFDELLTGGVHNLYIYKNHVYALSNGQRYDIINIEDPSKPYRVGKFQLDNPARSIHDVWIEDGIAYSSNWNDGVVMVDVGNGIVNGSPRNPVEIARYKVQGEANHAAFPFKSKSTKNFYVIAGDEIFPLTFDPGKVTIPSGYLHFIDFTDLENPREVARYQLPEAGSHNFWVKDDLLYVAYYNGGLRVVDISGELMGDLYRQGREVGHFLPLDDQGLIPNAAMTWGVQPYKDHIFFSDHNSGLWSAKLAGERPQETTIEVK